MTELQAGSKRRAGLQTSHPCRQSSRMTWTTRLWHSALAPVPRPCTPTFLCLTQSIGAQQRAAFHSCAFPTGLCCRELDKEADALASAFEREYHDDHSWDQLQEDEQGRLVNVVRGAGQHAECVPCISLQADAHAHEQDRGDNQAKRRRLLDAAASARIRRGLIRYLVVCPTAACEMLACESRSSARSPSCRWS